MEKRRKAKKSKEASRSMKRQQRILLVKNFVDGIHLRTCHACGCVCVCFLQSSHAFMIFLVFLKSLHPLWQGRVCSVCSQATRIQRYLPAPAESLLCQAGTRTCCRAPVWFAAPDVEPRTKRHSTTFHDPQKDRNGITHESTWNQHGINIEIVQTICDTML